VDELIRDRMHEALDAEPPRPGLRARVIGSVPMQDRTERWPRPQRFQRAGQFASGLVAALLAVAVIAGLVYSRHAVGSPNQGVGSHTAVPPRLISPEGIAVVPDGTVYVSDFVSDRVFRLLPGGALVSIAGGGVGKDGPATQAYLAHPGALAVDSQGKLYLVDNLGGTVRRVDRQGIISTVTTGYGSQGLAFDSAGVLYVGSSYSELRSIDQRGGSASLDLSSLPAPALQPGYLAFDSAGDLYVADQAPVATGPYPNPAGGCRIVRMTPSQKHTQAATVWGITVVAGTGVCGFSGDGGAATSADLNNPKGIVFDAAGNLYFADSDNHRIRRIDKNGIITTVAGTGVAGFSGDGGTATKALLAYPTGMGITSGGLLYISDGCACMDPTTAGHVRALRLSDGIITTVAGG